MGAIIFTTREGNPVIWIGYGTWTQISGKFLIAADSTYTVKSTGGDSTHVHSTNGHTLTTTEIPAHSHSIVTSSGSRTIGTTSTFQGEGEASNNYGHGVLVSGAASKVIATNTGGSKSHTHGNTNSASSLPPYYAVYIWERTA